MVGAGRFGEAWKAFRALTFSPCWGPHRPVRGVVLSCTDALPTHRALLHFLISSLAQGLGAVRLAWGRQHQPIIRRRPQRACPWAAFPILMAPAPSLGTPLAHHPRPRYLKVPCDGSEVTMGGGLCKAGRVFWVPSSTQS